FLNQSSQPALSGVQGLMFGHIPFVEVMTLYSLYNGSQPRVEGTKGENVTCSSLNTGMMGAAIDRDVTAIFHGHDHKNDYRIDVPVSQDRSLTIGYGRKSGYGGYLGGVADDPGARVINLALDPADSTKFSWSSYIRTEKGEIVDQKNETSNNGNQPQLACGMF
ncbi:purple acid phosphatase, partial [Perkinsus chesapeaki]